VGLALSNEFRTNTLHHNVNETFVRLIPKIQAPKKAADYKPIALCNVYFKIISKILTQRLKPLLHKLVSDNQSAFLAGRAIADNVLITHETLHFLKTSGAIKNCSMAVKTDMSKAYDRVEWSFIKAVLQRMGFASCWIDWILECTSTVTYSFLINSQPLEKVVPSRGIRQGDPLSPYIFILCGEVLSGLCRQAQVSKHMSQHSPSVNHLLFADDTMFFCKTKKKDCTALLTILQRYGDVSGQLINTQKSSVFFSRRTPYETQLQVKQWLSIINDGGLGKYLGLPEHFGRRRKICSPPLLIAFDKS